jgi:hypothetical protein
MLLVLFYKKEVRRRDWKIRDVAAGEGPERLYSQSSAQEFAPLSRIGLHLLRTINEFNLFISEAKLETVSLFMTW